MTWRWDPDVLAIGALCAGAYALACVMYRRRRGRDWPALRLFFFLAALGSAWFAIESPLDAAGDAAFAPHMVAHLILTDVTAPLAILSAPLMLVLGAVPTPAGRRIVAILRSRIAHVVTFPVVTWTVFIVALWLVHFSGFFEAALDDETTHKLEHLLFLSTALLFWLPVIPIGPMPWTTGALAYPLRMLYLFAAMPAEAFLGFAIYSSRHVMYARYAQAGIEDQRFAGEIMWVGASLIMFIAFMAVGSEWAIVEQRRDARRDAREYGPKAAP